MPRLNSASESMYYSSYRGRIEKDGQLVKVKLKPTIVDGLPAIESRVAGKSDHTEIVAAAIRDMHPLRGEGLVTVMPVISGAENGAPVQLWVRPSPAESVE